MINRPGLVHKLNLIVRNIKVIGLMVKETARELRVILMVRNTKVFGLIT